MMLDRKSTTSEFLHQIFQKNQLDLVPEIELSSNDLLIDLARIGLGIAFVPDFCIPSNEKELFILQLAEELPARQMVVAFNAKIRKTYIVSRIFRITLFHHYIVKPKFSEFPLPALLPASDDSLYSCAVCLPHWPQPQQTHQRNDSFSVRPLLHTPVENTVTSPPLLP